MNKTLLLSMIVILFSCHGKPKSRASIINHQTKPEVADSLTNELTNIYERGYINGLSVAIVNEKEILYQKGFGHANVELKEKYSENTIQPVGSISKTLIGIALLKAQEMGKLDLDDPVNKFLPFKIRNPYHPNEEIKIRHLANHTSTILDTEFYGKTYMLKEEPDSNSISAGLLNNFNPPKDSISMFTFIKKMLDEEGEWYKKDGFLNEKPGKTFEYSNLGATLAALIVEEATQQPFNEFTTNHILKPLGMSSSGWSFKEVNPKKLSSLYASTDVAFPKYYLITYPDGGFITSSQDMGKYLTELIKGYSGQGTILAPESYNTLFRVQQNADSLQESENPIMHLKENNGIFMGFAPKSYIGHTGQDPGVVAFMLFNSKSKLGRILILNTDIQGDNEGALKELFSVWNKLAEYQVKL